MYERIKLLLSNNFHGSSITLWGCQKPGSDIITISRSQAIRARRKLCGIAGCTCGDVAGCRPQMIEDSNDNTLKVL